MRVSVVRKIITAPEANGNVRHASEHFQKMCCHNSGAGFTIGMIRN